MKSARRKIMFLLLVNVLLFSGCSKHSNSDEIIKTTFTKENEDCNQENETGIEEENQEAESTSSKENEKEENDTTTVQQSINQDEVADKRVDNDESNSTVVTVLSDKEKYKKITDNELPEEDIPENESSNPNGVVPPSTSDISIYSLDAEDKETVAIVVSVPEGTEITPELIVQCVVDNLADKSYQITVDSVTQEANDLVINFNKSTPLIQDADESIETSILDALAQSILDNIPSCTGVIFRVGNEAYHSSNFEFELEQVYLSR